MMADIYTEIGPPDAVMRRFCDGSWRVDDVITILHAYLSECTPDLDYADLRDRVLKGEFPHAKDMAVSILTNAQTQAWMQEEEQ